MREPCGIVARALRLGSQCEPGQGAAYHGAGGQERCAEVAGEEAGRQAKIAIEARDAEAVARKEVEQRADELETVTEFQQWMLGGIDAEGMGRGIFADLRDGIREALEAGRGRWQRGT